MGFRGYFLRRVANAVLVWILVLILNFAMFYDKPLDSGLLDQIAGYLNFVFVERFGPMRAVGASNMPTLDYMFMNSTYSMLLLGVSLFVAIMLGLFLGSVAAYKQGGKTDAVVTVAVLLPFTFPVWWVALALRIYLVPFLRSYFPPFGWFSDRWVWTSPWAGLFNIKGTASSLSVTMSVDPLKTPMFVFISDVLRHLVIPFLAFVIVLTGICFIVARNSLRDVYTEDYIVTAIAKGLSPLKIMFKHALRNAVIPILSIIALTPPLLVVGVIMTEYIFSRPGIGHWLLKTAIEPWFMEPAAPGPVLQAIFIVFATMVIALQLVLDMSLSFLDPRIRTDGGGLEIGKPGETTRPRVSQPLHRRFWRFFKKFMKGYSGKFGFGVLLFFGVIALIVPFLPLSKNPYNPLYPNLENSALQPPSFEHLLGTDSLRRDMLTLILYGTRVSLIQGLGAVAVALIIGCFVGLFAGYYHDNWLGYILDRATDLFLSIPIIVVAVYFPLGSVFTRTMWAIGFTMWAIPAKLVRAQIISIKDRPFIEAAKAAGAGNTRILFRHLLPECLPAIASSTLFVVVTTLTIQSMLDYIGFQRRLWDRINPVLVAPYLSWGTILSYSSGTVYLAGSRWWLIFPPAICIALLGLALIAMGNKLIEVANPKLATQVALISLKGRVED